MPTTRPQTSKVSCAAGPARPDGELKRNGDVGSSRCPSRARARELSAIEVNATREFSAVSIGVVSKSTPWLILSSAGAAAATSAFVRSETRAPACAPNRNKMKKLLATSANRCPGGASGLLCWRSAALGLARACGKSVPLRQTRSELAGIGARRARARDHSQYGQRPDMGNETPCRPSIKRSPSGRRATEGMHSPRRREKIAAHLCWTRWVFRIAAPTVYLGSTKLPSRTIPHWLSIMYASHLSNP